METVKMVKVEPKLEEGRVNLSIIYLERSDKDSNDFLNFAYEQIGCDCIDVTSFGSIYDENHYSVTVDDEGLLKSNNVVMEVSLPVEGQGVATLQLAGTLLIGHCGYIDGNESDGMYELGLTDEQIHEVFSNIKINLIGITR